MLYAIAFMLGAAAGVAVYDIYVGTAAAWWIEREKDRFLDFLESYATPDAPPLTSEDVIAYVGEVRAKKAKKS